MRAALTMLLLLWPALATAQQEAAPAPAPAPTLDAAYTGEDLAYCAGMLSKLRELDPGMVSVISPKIDAYLMAEAETRTKGWSLGFPLKRAESRGAADAKSLMGQSGMLDFGAKASGPEGAGGGLAQSWTMVEPVVRRAQ